MRFKSHSLPVYRKRRCPIQGQRRAKKVIVRQKIKSRLNSLYTNVKTSPEYRKNTYLDFVNPSRKHVWSLPRKSRTINLNDFSFIDHPEKTLHKIRQLAFAETGVAELTINFLDFYCMDIAPYLLFKIFHGDLRKDQQRGGCLSPNVARVLETTRMADGMTISSTDEEAYRVWPMEMVECNQSEVTNSSTSASATRAVAFTETVNGWLSRVDLELTPQGEHSLFRCVAELLDNALIHGAGNSTAPSKAWMAGFMSEFVADDGQVCYICHFAVVNFGVSISDGLLSCANPVVENALTAKIRAEKQKGRFRLYRRRWAPHLLRTLYALQDGITRTSVGGNGLMEIIDFVGKMGFLAPSIDAGLENVFFSRLAIVSGDAYLLIPGLKPERGKDGKRYLALNAENDLDQPPDHRLVKRLDTSFPGTILTARFVINNAAVKELG